MQQIQTNSDKLTKKNVINRVSDVPGGVSLTIADLVAGQVVEEATPLTAPSSGKRTVCKQAKLLTGSTTTVFVVDSELHNFKVGEYLMQEVGGATYAITDITDNGDGTSSITVGTALEAATAGIFIYQALSAMAAGYQSWGFSAAITGASASGLTNDSTAYTASISVDGVAKAISIVGSASQTLADVVAEINTDLGASAVASIDTENDAIKIVSAITGLSSSVAITDTNLFASLTNANVAAETAVAGIAATLKNSAEVITKDAFEVPSASQVIFTHDAYVRADVYADVIGPLYLATLPGIIEINY